MYGGGESLRLMMLSASFIGIQIAFGLRLVIVILFGFLFSVVPIPLLVAGLIPGLIGGFTGGFLANRGFRGGVGSGILMALLWFFLVMFFSIPWKYGTVDQFPGVSALVQRSAATVASLAVGGAIGGLLRLYLRANGESK